MLSARSWSLIFCAASSWAMRARCSSWAWTTSASALARAADSRRLASATSLSTALMLRLLNESPRSSSSREHASLMMTASSSSSPRGMASPEALTAAGALALRALKSWSCLSRLMARLPADESTSVSVESCSMEGLEKNLLAEVFTIVSSSPTLTIAEARTVTFTGAGRPLTSTSAVWSVISMSTLMACAGITRTWVMTGTMRALHGPR